LSEKSKGSVVQTLPSFLGTCLQSKSEVKIQNAEVKPRAAG
jgi:hypothetical protein